MLPSVFRRWTGCLWISTILQCAPSGYKQFLLFHKLSKASETVAVHLFDFSDLVEGECYFGEALFFSDVAELLINVIVLFVFVMLCSSEKLAGGNGLSRSEM